MRVILSKTGRYVAKVTLQVVPSVTASVLGGYLLAQLHVASNTSATAPPRTTGVSESAQDSVPRVEVKPVETAAVGAASKPGTAEGKHTEAKAAEGGSSEAKAVKLRPPAAAAEKERPQEKVAEKTGKSRESVASLEPRRTESYKPIPYDPEPSVESLYVAPPAQTPAAASLTTQPAMRPPRIEAAQPAGSAGPKQSETVAEAAPPRAAPELPPPTILSPVNVAAPAPSAAHAQEVVVQPEPKRQQVAREESRGVFSTISSAAGTAANATGDTINWVFGLPGRLIGDGDDAQHSSPSPPEPRRLM